MEILEVQKVFEALRAKGERFTRDRDVELEEIETEFDHKVWSNFGSEASETGRELFECTKRSQAR